MLDANSTSMGESTVDDSLGETSDSALRKQLSLKVERSGSYIQITSPCENASPRIQYTFGTWRSPQHRKRKKTRSATTYHFIPLASFSYGFCTRVRNSVLVSSDALLSRLVVVGLAVSCCWLLARRHQSNGGIDPLLQIQL